MEPAGDQVERQTAALEETARNTDRILLILQLWSFLAVIGLIVLLIAAVKGSI